MLHCECSSLPPSLERHYKEGPRCAFCLPDITTLRDEIVQASIHLLDVIKYWPGTKTGHLANTYSPLPLSSYLPSHYHPTSPPTVFLPPLPLSSYLPSHYLPTSPPNISLSPLLLQAPIQTLVAYPSSGNMLQSSYPPVMVSRVTGRTCTW